MREGFLFRLHSIVCPPELVGEMKKPGLYARLLMSLWRRTTGRHPAFAAITIRTIRRYYALFCGQREYI
jgi:hypothetical protein